MIRLIEPQIMPTALEAQVDWLNDPEVVRYSEQRHKIHTVESQIAYVMSFLGSQHTLRSIVIDDGNTGLFIGSLTAYIDPYNSVANVGILIGHKASWGKGYGTEAWIMFCNSLFESGIRKIEAGCMSINVGMIEICRKYKMEREGTRPEHFVYQGLGCSLLQFGKFRG
jgi:RimJ/RimL family protein N-acetyltransferase